MHWTKVTDALPPEGKVVMTKIHDDKYPRNEKPLKRKGNLWYLQDGSMYVYYTPTHWKEVRESERH